MPEKSLHFSYVVDKIIHVGQYDHMELHKLLSPADVATLLGVDRRSVYKMSRLDQIPSRLKIRPKVLRFDAHAIEDWLKNCSKEQPCNKGPKVDCE